MHQVGIPVPAIHFAAEGTFPLRKQRVSQNCEWIHFKFRPITSLHSLLAFGLLNHRIHFAICRCSSIFFTAMLLAANPWNWLCKLWFKYSDTCIPMSESSDVLSNLLVSLCTNKTVTLYVHLKGPWILLYLAVYFKVPKRICMLFRSNNMQFENVSRLRFKY
jgi:hypothetical protein